MFFNALAQCVLNRQNKDKRSHRKKEKADEELERRDRTNKSSTFHTGRGYGNDYYYCGLISSHMLNTSTLREDRGAETK
jgi:hypothetical protein